MNTVFFNNLSKNHLAFLYIIYKNTSLFEAQDMRKSNVHI